MYSNRKTIGTAATGEAIGKGEPWNEMKHLEGLVPAISSRLRVTIDGVWIGHCIYWPLIHTTRN
jgi:hypothetical protein